MHPVEHPPPRKARSLFYMALLCLLIVAVSLWYVEAKATNPYENCQQVQIEYHHNPNFTGLYNSVDELLGLPANTPNWWYCNRFNDPTLYYRCPDRTFRNCTDQTITRANLTSLFRRESNAINNRPVAINETFNSTGLP